MNKRPSIIDVARQAGVSKSTVSLAMHNSPLLARETLELVQKTAKKMGYRPNILFSIMGSGNRLKKKFIPKLPIAFLYDSPEKNITDYRYLPPIAAKYGYSIDPFNLADFKTAKEVEKILYHRGYSAVVIGRVINQKSLAYNLNLNNFSVISNTNTLWKYNFHRVSYDVFKAVQMAWNKTVECGYKRIAVATCRHSPTLPDDELRLAAVLERQKHYEGLIEKIPPYQMRPEDNNALIDWVKRWDPDAVIGLHVGQYYALKEKLPKKIKDIGFCSLIVILNPANKWTQLISGVIYQEKELAEVTISILDQEIRNRIHGTPENIISINIAPKWHEGKTLKAIKY